MILYNFDLLESLIRWVRNNPSLAEDFYMGKDVSVEPYLSELDNIDDETLADLEGAFRELARQSRPFTEDFFEILGITYRSVKNLDFDEFFKDIRRERREELFKAMEVNLAELYWACALEAGRPKHMAPLENELGAVPKGISIATSYSCEHIGWECDDDEREIREWSELFEAKTPFEVIIKNCDIPLEFWRILPKLKEMRVLWIGYNCTGLSDPALANLARCESLKKLLIQECSTISEYGLITSAMGPSMMQMRITDCPHIQNLTFGKTAGLRAFDISSCAGLETLSFFRGTMEDIEISRCPELRSLSFSCTANLNGMTLLHCNKLCSIPLFSSGEPWSRVIVGDCPSLHLASLRFVANLRCDDIILDVEIPPQDNEWNDTDLDLSCNNI